MANASFDAILLASAWVSGMYLPISVITKSSALKIIAMCLPFSYPVAIINYGRNQGLLLLFDSAYLSVYTHITCTINSFCCT